MARYRREGFRLPPTASEAEAMRVMLDTLETGARRVGASFTDPDDDWRPIWVVATPDGFGTIMTPERIATPADKVTMTRIVADFARTRGAIAIGHVHSSWMVSREDVPEARMREIESQMNAQHGSTEGIPERREVLLIAAYTASAQTIGVAPIERRAGAPPLLGPFKADVVENSSGRMFDPLVEALRRIG